MAILYNQAVYLQFFLSLLVSFWCVSKFDFILRKVRGIISGEGVVVAFFCEYDSGCYSMTEMSVL